MDAKTDPSSSAAQSAQGEEDERHGGLIGRLFGAFRPAEPDDKEDETAPGPVSAVTTPGMVNLRRMRVEDVMIPTADIVSVAVDTSKEELLEVFRDSGLTRLPVYEGTLDSPVGLIHLKDFALTYGFNGKSGDNLALTKLLRPLLYVPPSMPIGVLLQKMQAERIHMALVIDEFGGVDGLVTLEDLIEQVIGEIEDEHDLEEGDMWTREAAGSYLVEAKAPLDDFEAEIGRKLTVDDEDEDEVDTLGGLVFLLSGHVPARGEVIVHPDGVEFEVVDADPRRIKRLRVRLPGSRDE